MSWRDRLVEASFRKVPFFIEGGDRTVGRNTTVDELTPANKNEEHLPYVQDNGIALDQFTLDGYVIANFGNSFDYFKERDNLKEALQKFGPGELVHPFWGTFNVALIGQAKISESFSEGGIAKFTMTFCRVDNTAIPVKTSDYKSAVDASASKSRAATGDTLDTGYKTGGLEAVNSAKCLKETLKDLSNNIKDLKNVSSQYVSDMTAEIAANIVLVDSIIDLPNDIISMIARVFDKIVDVCKLSIETVAGATYGLIQAVTGQSLIKAMSESLKFDTGISLLSDGTLTSGGSSSMGFIAEDQLLNVLYLSACVKTEMINTACRVAIETNFVSQQDMGAYINLLIEQIDAFLLYIGDFDGMDDLFAAVQDMRGVFIESMYARITSLRKEVEYKVPPKVMSSLELAYDLYEDIDRSDEILERNREISHPGFLPGGQIVSVLDE